MATLVDHFMSGLQIDQKKTRVKLQCENSVIIETGQRRKQENKVKQLLAELLMTERKYVEDLESVSNRICNHCFYLFQFCWRHKTQS